MEETRETFAGVGGAALVLWYVLSAASTALFAWGVARLALKWRRGRAAPAGRPPRLTARRAGRALRTVLTHAWIRRRDGLAGLAHAGIFYGFLVLLAGTTILAFDDHVARPLGFGFWHGPFYLGYSLFLDAFGVALLAGLCVFGARRLRGRPPRIAAPRADGAERPPVPPPWWQRLGDATFLWGLVFLGATGFLLEGLRIAHDPHGFERWAPFGWLLGQGLREAGLGAGLAADAHLGLWWVHGVAALAFVAAIPFTKAVHMLAGPPAIAARGERPGRALPLVPPDAAPEQIGYRRIGDLSPLHLLDLDACTRCGKCHVACPATASGAPLSPRDLILDLRAVAASNGVRGEAAQAPLVGDGRIAPETVWSCTQCMACVDICPVGIEQAPIIVELRRGLAEDGELEEKAQPVLEAIHRTGNSFGEQRRKRARWASELDAAPRDARREAVEYLWWVGDYASFDPRNQRNTRALARLLAAAGVDVGIVYDAERTAGNDVRRVGEEGLFQALAEANLETLGACDFGYLLTSDPHTFNTLRNEYPALGAAWSADQVVHHSQLLRDLLRDGALEVTQPFEARATYHDPCTLGRFNGEYEAPREVIRRVGLELVEMGRNRDDSFCCGAGGGRIWMAERRAEGAPRPSEQRIHEAVALPGVELFVVACPKDVTMYEDAIRTTGNAERLRLRELSELVHDAVGLA